MPVTTLDPKTALIVLDLQKGIAGYPLLHPMADMVARSNELARAFRAKCLPVVLVTVDDTPPGRTEQARGTPNRPADFADLVPNLDHQPGDILIRKKSSGAFARTELEAKLRALGVTQVVLTGVSTSSAVESTGRQAYELGFNVTFPLDATTDARQEAFDHSVEKVFPRLGERGSTQDVLNALQAVHA
ncbi:MAG TPA: isochorismatase family protein [Caulobacteraceae bacterium]|jgi:nicotinamidase-related amidase|nr:isochorismatase family protein [Caulobacteraceae bacterium]